MLGCLLTLKSDINGSVWLHPALDVSEREMQLMPFEGLPPKYLELRQVQYKWEVILIDNTSFLMPSHSLAIPCFTLAIEENVLPLPEKGILPSAVRTGGHLPEERSG